MTPKLKEIIKTKLPPEFTVKEASVPLAMHYKAPAKALESSVKEGDLIRLKRGLYVLSEQYEPLAAANTIGLPSYVSFETALAYYELIPERVFPVYSVIDGRPFEHTVASTRYIYRSQNRKLFAKGMTTIEIGGRSVLFATREKALLDTLAQRGLRTDECTPHDILRFVEVDLRIDHEDLARLSQEHLLTLCELYRNRAPTLFTKALSSQGIGYRGQRP